MNINEKLKQYAEYKRMEEDIKKLVEETRKELEEYMTSLNIEEIQGTEHRCTWHKIVSDKLDTKAFKNSMPDVYSSFLKRTESKRFLFQ